MNFILISDAVQLTGLNRQTIRNWIDKGVIPAKKINGTFYVDKRTFKRLHKDITDIESARQRLEAIRKEYAEETSIYRTMKEQARMDHDTDRILSICVNSGVRMHFFDTVLSMMSSCGVLTEREATILSSLLNGTAFEEVAEEFGVNRERIRQIAEKAIHKSRDFAGLAERISLMDEKDKEIQTLQDENKVLRDIIYRHSIKVAETELSETERRLVTMGRHDLKRLLSRRFIDEDISVRALNCLSSIIDNNGNRRRIETVGELCRMTKDDFYKQRQVGRKTLDEMTEFLEKNGLEWGLDIDKIISMT